MASLLVPFPTGDSSCKVQSSLVVPAVVEVASVVSVVSELRPGVNSVSSEWLLMVLAGHQGIQRQQQSLALLAVTVIWILVILSPPVSYFSPRSGASVVLTL